MMPPKPTPPEQRFWRHVQKTDGCWLWTASTNYFGYGKFAVANHRWVRAHRFAYELLVGPIVHGLELMHECNTPACVRPGPGHVRPGTHAENCAHMKACGRGRGPGLKGERNGRAILRAETVAEIRRLASLGAKGAPLARLFGISKSQVYNIIHGRQWRREGGAS